MDVELCMLLAPFTWGSFMLLFTCWHNSLSCPSDPTKNKYWMSSMRLVCGTNWTLLTWILLSNPILPRRRWEAARCLELLPLCIPLLPGSGTCLLSSCMLRLMHQTWAGDSHFLADVPWNCLLRKDFRTSRILLPAFYLTPSAYSPTLPSFPCLLLPTN